MAAMSASQSEATASRSDAAGGEALLDVSVLRELARKGLIDALNSVRGCHSVIYSQVYRRLHLG